MHNLYIHIGHRKTATSWMQDILFKGLEGVNYIAKDDTNYPNWLIAWHYLDDFAFENRIDEIRKQLKACIVTDMPNFISSEAFTNTGVIASQAYRIKRIAPDSKIILTLRNPIELVKSHYQDDIKHDEVFLPLMNYLDWKRTPPFIGKRKSIYLPDFFFAETINIYEKLFGSKNVCVLKYEDLNANFDNFFGKLGRFMDVIFDQVKIKRLMKIRVNEGANFHNVIEYRARNLHAMLKKYFPIAASKITIEDISANISNGIISTKLETKLAEYFNGNTSGYY